MNNSLKASTAQKLQGVAQPQALSAQEAQRLQLEQHLRKLVQSDPKEAREVLEMSQEQAPELYLIAQNQPSSQWAASLMSSESMLSLLSRKPSQVKTLLEQPDLRSLLELLP
jgi:hypothetical protein